MAGVTAVLLLRRGVGWVLTLVAVMATSLLLLAAVPIAVAVAAISGTSQAAAPAAATLSVSGEWTVPIQRYRVMDDFGPRAAPCTYCSTMHWGVDLASGCNEPIYAASAGRVLLVGMEGTYGFRVVIDHAGGVQTLYAHLALDSARVAPGDPVTVGAVIAQEGRTGQATGCHLHFETRVAGTRVDPVPFLQLRGVSL